MKIKTEEVIVTAIPQRKYGLTGVTNLIHFLVQIQTPPPTKKT